MMEVMREDFFMKIISYTSFQDPSSIFHHFKHRQPTSSKESTRVRWDECILTRKYMRFGRGKNKPQDQFSENFFRTHATDSLIETFIIRMTFLTDELLEELMRLFEECSVSVRNISMEDVRPYFSEETLIRFFRVVRPELLCWRASLEDCSKLPCITVPPDCLLLDIANAHVELGEAKNLEHVVFRDVPIDSQKIFMKKIIDGEVPKLKCALMCVDSIGQRQENLWTIKQWKEAGYKHRTLYSRQPGAHTIHEIRKLDSKWLDKDRVIQFASFVTETFISASSSSPSSTRLRNFAQEKGPARTLSWKGPERRASSSEAEPRSTRSLTIPKQQPF